ncbi:hypothetical protein L1887_28849 [Cichorium endivia]|nr:hypothetical protein L1887_28849 [Cichorium endivia]
MNHDGCQAVNTDRGTHLVWFLIMVRQPHPFKFLWPLHGDLLQGVKGLGQQLMKGRVVKEQVGDKSMANDDVPTHPRLRTRPHLPWLDRFFKSLYSAGTSSKLI